jgi:hypothetical protein
MFKALDRVWFWLKDRTIGYHSGYIDGFNAGMDVLQGQTIALLSEKNPALSDQSFQLGYAHAVEVVKGNVK